MTVAYVYLALCYYNTGCVIVPQKMTEITCQREAEKLYTAFCINTQPEPQK